MSGYGLGGRFGGVDDRERVADGCEGAVDGGFEKRVVGAAEKEGLCVGGFGQRFGQVDFEDFVGDRVIDPAFFNQRDEEGAGLFVGSEAESVEGTGVGVGLDGGCGSEDEDVGFWWDLRWSIPGPRIGTWGTRRR